jgi:hypothetical protein
MAFHALHTGKNFRRFPLVGPSISSPYHIPYCPTDLPNHSPNEYHLSTSISPSHLLSRFGSLLHPTQLPTPPPLMQTSFFISEQISESVIRSVPSVSSDCVQFVPSRLLLDDQESNGNIMLSPLLSLFYIRSHCCYCYHIVISSPSAAAASTSTAVGD